MASNIEIGCSTGDLLTNLEGVICHVFIPVLDPTLLTEGGRENEMKEAHHALKVCSVC